MKRISAISILVISGAFLMQSCTKVDEPYYTVQSVEADTNTRTVLLEDYTGHKCTNCGPASKVANTLQETYAGQVFVIAVHAGSFAAPDMTHYVPYLTGDYRSATGNEWNSNSVFYIDQNPKGMVNRRPYKTKMSFVSSEWNNAIIEALKLPKAAIMTMHNTFDTGTKMLNTRIDTRFLIDQDSKVNLCVCILEDSIYGGQLNIDPSDSTPIIKNFRFMHVLRGSINGFYGEQIADNPDADQVFTKNYTFDFSGKSWIPSHCSLVAFISDPDTYEVLHVIKSAVIKP